jgi:uncharacterized membrane protein
MTWRGNVTGLDRFYAALPYLLPLLDGLTLAVVILKLVLSGAALDTALSIMGIVLFVPLTLTQFLGPYASLILFFGIYLLVVNNPNIKYFIRYHALQSLIIGIAGSLGGLILSLLPSIGMVNGILSLIIGGAVGGMAVYSMYCAALGNYGTIPMISEAVEAQMRYR